MTQTTPELPELSERWLLQTPNMGQVVLPYQYCPGFLPRRGYPRHSGPTCRFCRYAAFSEGQMAGMCGYPEQNDAETAGKRG